MGEFGTFLTSGRLLTLCQASAISVICLLNAGSIIYLQRRKKIQTGSVDETAEEVFITTKEIQVTREMVD
jgi:hypothetical protein